MKILTSILVAIGAIVISGNAAEINLVKNGSFEKLNSKGQAAAWGIRYIKDRKGTAEIKVSEDQAQSGKSSICFSCEGDNAAYFAINQQLKNFKPGDKLEIKAYIYIEEFESGRIAPFHFSIKDGAKTKYFTPIKITPEKCEIGKWISYKVTLDLAKYKELKTIVFWSLTYAKFEGRFYIDNISIKKI